jgi:hypothetical protein
MKRSSKTIETLSTDNPTYTKTLNKNMSVTNIHKINNHSHNTTYKTNTQIRESIISTNRRINLDTDNSNSHEVSLNLSNFILPVKKRSDRYSYTINSTNQPSMVNSNKNTDENISTISYSNNNLYKTVNTQNNSGQIKFEFSENNNQSEEQKLKEVLKMKEKSVQILQHEYDKINKKVEEAKKGFNVKMQKYDRLKQSNDQLKKMICMMIVNKK